MDPLILLVLFAFAVAPLVGFAAARRLQRERSSAIAPVQRGAFAEAVFERFGDPGQFAEGLHVRVSRPQQPQLLAETAVELDGNRRADLHAGAVVGGAEGATYLADWAHVDGAVLEGFRRYAADDTASVLDLYAAAGGKTGESLEGFSNGLRGHVGEQEIIDQLGRWAGDAVVVPTSGSNEGFDLELFGRAINAKVTGDAGRTAAEHFAEHPDIPLIINADAANIPDTAVRLDLTEPFDAGLLDTEQLVIVAEGLQLSDLGDAVADAAGFGDLGGATDGLPGLGVAVAAVRSGVREGRLLQVHDDKARLARNIATDTALIGGGALVGAKAGALAGAAIDAAAGGMLLGIPTVLGGIVGGIGAGWQGGKLANSARTRELRTRQEALTASLDSFGRAKSHSEAAAAEAWQDAVEQSEQRLSAAQAGIEEIIESTAQEAHEHFAAASGITPTHREALLLQAGQRVDEARRAERSRLARARAAAWHQAAELCGNQTEEIMDVVLASPGGAEVVGVWLDEAEARRHAGMQVLAAGATLVTATAHRFRSIETAILTAERDRVQEQAQAELRPYIARVEHDRDRVESEARALGLAA